MSAGFSLHFTVYMYPQSALYSWSAVSSLLSLFYSYNAENLFSLSNTPQVSMVYSLINHAGYGKNAGRICKSRE